MKNKLSMALLLLSPLLVTASFAGAANKLRTPLTTAKPAADKRFNIAENGAIGDGKTLNTKAIQALIDKCAQKGGTIVIPQGIFLTGSLFIKQGVNVEFLEGSVLKGSTNIEDYPKAMTRIEGHFEPWRAALLNADKVDHLQITGKGTLDGSGQPFWKEFYSRRSADPKTTNLNVERPRLTFLQNCKDVKIDGIAYTNSGFWNLHIYRCQKVTVNNCRFVAPDGRVPDDHAPSSDGIDVDSSQDLEISNCFFSVGDDDIALKGSKGPFAMQDKDSPPVERIYIHDCIFEAGGGIMTCGSEATIVRDVKIERCTTRKPTVLRLKLRPDTPQQYENITLTDITMEGGATIFSIAPWSQYFDLRGQAPPTSIVRNIKVSNVKGTGASLGKIAGNPGTTFGDITLKNVDVTVKNPGFDRGSLQGLVFENVVVNGAPLILPAATPAK
ncbi:MAG: glycosyl hydrolase family 28 protein [Bacteroidota bacterium]